MPTPFIKFPGGKRYLADVIISHFPKKYQTYFEPMVGGGAIFFELAHRDKIKRAWLGDINENLILMYENIRDHLPEVMTYLKALKKKRDRVVEAGDEAKELYYNVRKRVNRTKNGIEKVAGLIYLSKTCFNGLFRFNSKGEFNAPVGDQKNPKICDTTNLQKVAMALKRATISCAPYDIVCRKAKESDLIYFDPPYWPVRESSFVGYAASKFEKKDHIALAEHFTMLANQKIYLVMSNADTPEVRKLYKKFNITTVQAPRRINRNGSGRGLVKELIIKNY